MRFGRAPLRALAAMLVWASAGLLLGGCASLPFFGDKDKSTSADAPAATVDQYHFEVVAPAPLGTLLTTYLDLARFQKTPQSEGVAGIELDRLAGAAPAQARTLLETEGYFNATVTMTRAGPNAADGLPTLRMTVVPGERVHVRNVDIEATGPMNARTANRDADTSSRIEAIRKSWQLKPGEPFRQPAWSDAKNTALAEVRADGYPTAAWRETHAQIDAAANTADLSLTLDSGPLYRLGPIRIEGVQRYDEDAVRKLATFFPGAVYNEKLLLDYQDRLVKLGLFEGASVEITPDATNTEAVPVVVKVKEQPLQQATFGVGYSANTGPRVSVEHFDRQVFGQRWVAHSTLQYGPDLKSLGTELTSYPLDNLNRNLLAGNVQQLVSADETQNSWSVRAGRTQDSPRFERLYYAEVAHARLDSAPLVTSAEAASVNYNWLRRDLDNVLLPTDGTTLNAQAGIGYGDGTQTLPVAPLESSSRGPFARAYTRFTLYKPIGGWYGSARVEAGEVFVHDRIGVPDTLLFRAGGDDSVRGYGYRTLGPEVNGAIVGGRVLVTGSIEMAHPFTAKIPSLWGAVFVDAGSAADRWNELHPAVGYGVGLRWRSPVGPLRVDVAYGEQVHRFRLHLSVGIAF